MNIYEIFSGNQENLFNQVVDHIDYFKRLNVDCVWFTPFYKSNSYHSYDATDYTSIREEIGTVEEFKNMVKVLKENDIITCLDFVFAHTSSSHEWFNTKNEYYYWSDVKLEKRHQWNNEDQASHLAENWFYDDNRKKYYYAAFDKTMPSLNLDNESLRQEIIDVVNYWYNLGVRGLRLDAIIHVFPLDDNNEKRTEFWKWFKANIPSDCYVVGEAWTSYDIINQFSNALGSCFDFPLNSSLLYSIKSNNPLQVSDTLHYTNYHLTSFSSNHDTNRPINTLDFDIEKYKLYLWLSRLFAQKHYCLYYGDELGIAGFKEFNGDLCVRGKFDWDEVYRQLQDRNSFLNEYLSVNDLIESNEILKFGEIVRIDHEPHYDKLTVHKVFNNERIKIKLQRTDKNLDKHYTVRTFSGWDIVLIKYERVDYNGL